MSAADGSLSVPTKPQGSSLFVSLSTKAMSLLPTSRLSRDRSRRHPDGLITPRGISRSPSPLRQSSTLLTPEFQRRSTSPGISSSLMPHRSPRNNPIASPTSPTFGSWIPVDGGSCPPSRPVTPDAPGNENVARRRVNPGDPPPRRASSYTT